MTVTPGAEEEEEEDEEEAEGRGGGQAGYWHPMTASKPQFALHPAPWPALLSLAAGRHFQPHAGTNRRWLYGQLVSCGGDANRGCVSMPMVTTADTSCSTDGSVRGEFLSMSGPALYSNK